MTNTMTAWCLGTAQFGLDYGCTNHHGQVSAQEIENILSAFYQSGGRYLDTAPAYGNSEQVLANYSSDFSIISKTPHVSADLDAVSNVSALIDTYERSLECSLTRLNKSSLDVLLIHQADLLNQKTEPILDWFAHIKTQGLVKAVGVSIYEMSDIQHWDRVQPSLDWVQLPMNIADHRATSHPQYQALKASGVHIQVRSVFLQGLLLDHHQAKVIIPPAAQHFFDALDDWCKHNHINKMQLLFQAVLAHNPELMTFAVNKASELQEILTACEQDKADIFAQWREHFEHSSHIPEHWLNPYVWKPLP